MAIFEVFLKKDGRDEFRHVGALDAANDELALVSARECYVRRAEGDLLWVVRRDNILSPEREFTAPNADKPHRHHSGEAVAARRKALREMTKAQPDE
ncbi:MAG: 1,2-phenylacetyl-CoA epoxidase subunit B [Acidimicrobiales bacterium]|jgi:ring-1,2-phenylacetyl-CoA epoxidase subunit PaaB